eukprot:COSAG02_NODE_8917_length_2401_cov_1.577324_3_plen_241_part_00
MLRSPDDRRFLKRDCGQQQRPFDDVVRELFAQPPPAAAAAAAAAAAGRMYARSPLRAGLRAEVELQDLHQLVGGDDNDARSSGTRAGAHDISASRPIFKDENCGVWLGTAGNVTPLHYDLCHGFLVQVLGTKTVTYFEPDDYRYLYQRKEHPELSQVDLDAWRRHESGAQVDSAGPSPHEKWPRFADATPRTVTLEPGDCLYTPPFWWHHVATSELAPALSVLVPFDMSPEEPVHPAHFM